MRKKLGHEILVSCTLLFCFFENVAWPKKYTAAYMGPYSAQELPPLVIKHTYTYAQPKTITPIFTKFRAQKRCIILLMISSAEVFVPFVVTYVKDEPGFYDSFFSYSEANLLKFQLVHEAFYFSLFDVLQNIPNKKKVGNIFVDPLGGTLTVRSNSV